MVVIGKEPQYARVATTEEPPVIEEAGNRVVEVHHHHYHSTPEPASASAVVGRGVAGSGEEPEIGVGEYLKNSALAVKDQLFNVWCSARPWSEVLDTSRVSFPLPDEWVTRAESNFDRFKKNYAIVTAGFVGVGLLHNPIGLVLFGLAASAIGKKLAKIHAQDPTFEAHRGKTIGWSILGFLALMVTGVGGAIVGAVSTSAILCGIHSIVYRPLATLNEDNSMPGEDPFGSQPVPAAAL
eukprot:CAMPEP_0185845086 /NCGR_PEP_ID=MMETSP1354-20130828/1148_1 /TAXON_ID=708628 /ORGANISM="Erythrolobus madagascarensis, Strain CCMP3276" /LENGTH=238 /DNA_ID=CAMNT_0028544963 /DNA_START=182 /DNA_END=898 /DNA_ORIENTATION=+